MQNMQLAMLYRGSTTFPLLIACFSLPCRSGVGAVNGQCKTCNSQWPTEAWPFAHLRYDLSFSNLAARSPTGLPPAPAPCRQRRPPSPLALGPVAPGAMPAPCSRAPPPSPACPSDGAPRTPAPPNPCDARPSSCPTSVPGDSSMKLSITSPSSSLSSSKRRSASWASNTCPPEQCCE